MNLSIEINKTNVRVYVSIIIVCVFAFLFFPDEISRGDKKAVTNQSISKGRATERV